MKLHAERWGEGPQPLLLLHGFTGDRTTWRHLQAHWGERFTVTAVDLPGHGESPLPSRAGIEGFTETIHALAEALDSCGANVAVVGYSLGARLALPLAIARPQRVSRLVLESGSPGLRRRKVRMARRRDDESLAGMIESRGVAAFVDHWEALPLFSTLRLLPESLQEAVRARRLAATASGLASALRTLGTGVQPSLWPLLPGLRTPTLLITGALDRKFSEVAEQMAGQLPLAWFHAIPGVGHAPHLEAPAEYAEEVARFLETPWVETPVMDAEERRVS